MRQVIPAWMKAVLLMAEEAKWKLFVPADIAFGERGPLDDQTVSYDMKLLEVLNCPPAGRRINASGQSS